MSKWIVKSVLGVLLMLSVMGIAFAEDVLVVEGLFSEDLQISIGLIKELPQHTQKVVAVMSGGQEDVYTVTGALFSDLLAIYGREQEDIFGLRLVAKDGYAIDLSSDILQDRQIILTYLVNNMPLEDNALPLQITIPGERAMYWVRSLARIEVLSQKQIVEVKTIRFLESLTKMCPLEDYNYQGDVDQALRIQVILDELELTQSPERVFFKAADGFEKNETYAEFSASFIKMTGAYAPLFIRPGLPEGMQIKDIVYCIFGDNAFVSLAQGQKSLASLVADLGLPQDARYRLTALDGYSIELGAADINNGYVYVDDQAYVHSHFPDLPKNTSIRGLYTIEILE